MNEPELINDSMDCSGSNARAGLVPATTSRLALKLVLINVGVGVLVWVFARRGVHVGASGMVFGLFGLILASAIWAKAVRDVLIGGLVLFLFGGLLYGLLPSGGPVSWESHLAGLVVGFSVGAVDARGRHKNR